MSHIDYLRLTSPDVLSKIQWLDLVKNLFGSESKHAKIMQFSGVRGSTVPWFIGTAEIAYRPYYMMQISGGQADSFFNHYVPEHFVNCTRIDFQRTLKWRNYPNADDLYKHMDTEHPTVYHSKIEGSDRTWTVYIGKRGNQKMTRIYIKILDTKYLRVEFELKSNLANVAFDHLIDKRRTKDSIFEGLVRESEVYPLLTEFDGNTAKEAALVAHGKPANMANKIKWIQSLGQTLERYYFDHDFQAEVINLIEFLDTLRNR